MWTSTLDHFDHDARHVIARPHVERQLAEAVGAFLDVGVFRDELQELFVGDGAGEAVAAEQEAVPVFEEDGLDFRAVADFLAAEVFPEDVLEACSFASSG